MCRDALEIADTGDFEQRRNLKVLDAAPPTTWPRRGRFSVRFSDDELDETLSKSGEHARCLA